MREIKFRAWDKTENRMARNVEELKFNSKGIYAVVLNHLGFEMRRRAKDVELMQYTGLKDRNGKEIFEGDIAFHRDYECSGYVVFSDDELAFAFLVITGSNNKGPTTEFEWLYDYADGLEIIGNIHENPELLGVEL